MVRVAVEGTITRGFAVHAMAALCSATLLAMLAGCGDDGGSGSFDNTDTSAAGRGDERGPCYPNDTCNGALVCVAGICGVDIAEPGALGGACLNDGSCEQDWVCTGGRCGDPTAAEGTRGAVCGADASCEAGLDCLAGICVDEVSVPGAEGAVCENTTDCAGGLNCVSSVCVPASEEPVPDTMESLREELYDFCTRDCENESECNPDGLSPFELQEYVSDCFQSCPDYADDGELSAFTAPCVRLFMDAGNCMFALTCSQYISANDWVVSHSPQMWSGAPYCGDILDEFVQTCQ